MATFFFDITHDDECILDDTGLELADEGAARLEALKAVTEIARDTFHFGGDSHATAVQVRDQTGRPFYAAHLKLEAGWVT